jgi:hypothetical protein
MNANPHSNLGRWAAVMRTLAGVAMLQLALAAFVPQSAWALPLFARQTGQNCLACHAGGQFPELTPYGRMFKLTGYTLGEHTVPLSAMAVASYSKVADTTKSDDPNADFSKNASLIFATASVFLGGRISDNFGAFAQFTYDPYAVQSDSASYSGHTNADNIDIRYADRFVDATRDFIFGVSLNNNPSLTDPWDTAPAWMQYVPVPSPSSSSFIDGNSPYPGYSTGGNVAGITAYGLWNGTIYGELGVYGTANHVFQFLSAGVAAADLTNIRGAAPYARLALNREWGASSLMIGIAGMVSQIYDDPLATSDPSTTHHYKDYVADAQYQYLLDPHAVTVQAAYGRTQHVYPDSIANQPVVDVNGNPLANSNASDTTNVFRAKLTYVYQAKFGGSVNYFNLSGTTNTLNYDPTRVYGNVSGNPGTAGTTFELFWTPIQYVRIGAQFTAYNKFNGASQNYDGAGRNASDNNSLFLYVWGAY